MTSDFAKYLERPESEPPLPGVGTGDASGVPFFAFLAALSGGEPFRLSACGWVGVAFGAAAAAAAAGLAWALALAFGLVPPKNLRMSIAARRGRRGRRAQAR